MKKFTIYGERCSGTNYLENLILANFDVEITWQYGWKHFFGFNDLSNSDDCLFVGIVRNPYDFINSFFREKHHLPFKLRENKYNFLNNEFYSFVDNYGNTDETKEIMKDRNIYSGERYKNIFQMRHTIRN